MWHAQNKDDKQGLINLIQKCELGPMSAQGQKLHKEGGQKYE